MKRTLLYALLALIAVELSCSPIRADALIRAVRAKAVQP